MSYLPKLEFANVHLLYGDELTLVDLFEELSLPALQAEGVIREYGETKYMFLEVDLYTIQTPSGSHLVVAGRLLKDMVIQRAKVFEDGALVEKPLSIESAETSLFVLFVESHRLLYLQETAQAPGIRAFRSTWQKSLLTLHDNLVRRIFEELKESGTSETLDAIDSVNAENLEKHTLTAIRALLPKPDLTVVPLGTEATLEAFLNRFEVLERIDIDILETNDELDNSELFEAIRAQKEALGSKSTDLVHANPKGLKKSSVKEALQDSINQGTVAARFRGRDKSNALVRGEPEEFALRVPVNDLPATFMGRLGHMVGVFLEHVKGGVISLPPDPPVSSEELKAIEEGATEIKALEVKPEVD